MKKSTKAVLFSALVSPGAGYFVLGARKRGLAALIASAILIGVVVIDSNHKAKAIAQKIVNGDITLDIATIREQIATAPGMFSERTIEVAVALLLTLWVVGIVDAYRLGRQA